MNKTKLNENIRAAVRDADDEKPKQRFIIKIDDSYTEWQYEVNLTEAGCIRDVIDRLAAAFDIHAPEGTCVREYPA